MSQHIPFMPLRTASLAMAAVLTLSSMPLPVAAFEGARERPQAAEMQRERPKAAEMQREPRGYTRFERPHTIDQRPAFDRAWFGHNFQARHGYRIGPYHAPQDYRYHRWVYGEILPGPFWADQYLLSDFWVFGLEIPPAGYEWVRYGPDAILVSLDSGEIGQVVYDTFQ